MIGLDCNIHVQLAFADHPANARTVAAIESEIQRGEKLAFPPLIATEFPHVATDEKRFAPPLSMKEAVEWLRDFLSSQDVKLLHPTDESFRQTLRWMEQFKLGRKRILDTHFAAILFTSGVRRLFTANPSDFTVFGVLEIINP